MSLDPYVVVSDEPCADCVGSMLVALCGRTDDGSDGPCVLRGDHFGPCYGESDVASDWSPAAACRRCCVCPCGSTSDGTSCRFCAVTMKPGYEPPTFDPTTHRS
jgi:hypothetical protein